MKLKKYIDEKGNPCWYGECELRGSIISKDYFYKSQLN